MNTLYTGGDQWSVRRGGDYRSVLILLRTGGNWRGTELRRNL